MEQIRTILINYNRTFVFSSFQTIYRTQIIYCVYSIYFVTSLWWCGRVLVVQDDKLPICGAQPKMTPIELHIQRVIVTRDGAGVFHIAGGRGYLSCNVHSCII